MASQRPDAATGSKAEAELLDYVARQRQRQQPTSECRRLVPAPPRHDPAREERLVKSQQERAALRQRAEIYGRGQRLIYDAGARYRGCRLANFRVTTDLQQRVVDALHQWIEEDFPCGVVLYGPVGTGKDHLAFAACRAAILAGHTVGWVNGQSWFGQVRDAIDTNRSEASLINELARPAVLCLSDPLPPPTNKSDGSLTPHQAAMLYRLVDARYCRANATIVTLNVADDNEADERLGEPTWDRLCHDAWKLHCNWPTYRRPGRVVR